MLSKNLTIRLSNETYDSLFELFPNPTKTIRLLINSYLNRCIYPNTKSIEELKSLRSELHSMGVNLNQLIRKINSNEYDLNIPDQAEIIFDTVIKITNLTYKINSVLKGNYDDRL